MESDEYDSSNEDIYDGKIPANFFLNKQTLFLKRENEKKMIYGLRPNCLSPRLHDKLKMVQIPTKAKPSNCSLRT